MRKLVKVFEAEQYDGNWPTDNAFKFLSWLKEKVEQIPEEFRSSAKIEIDSIEEYGNAHAMLQIYYYRPETEEEMIMSVNTEKRKQEGIVQREMMELNRLKKKYGN